MASKIAKLQARIDAASAKLKAFAEKATAKFESRKSQAASPSKSTTNNNGDTA